MSKIPRDPNHHTPPKGQRPAGTTAGNDGRSEAPSDASASNPNKTGLEGGQPAAATEQPGRGNNGKASKGS